LWWAASSLLGIFWGGVEMMKTFDVIVTRDTTESCTVVVEADSVEEAHEAAVQRALTDIDLVWEQDDTPNASADPYVTFCGEVE
jgi:hypothetical protein